MNTKFAVHHAKPTSLGFTVTVTSHRPGRIPGYTRPVAFGIDAPLGSRAPTVPDRMTFRK